MAAGFVTGQQKADDRLKIRKRASSGPLYCNNGGTWNRSLQRCEDPVVSRIATHPHRHTTHAPYTCDNGGKWNHSRQRCDCPTGFEGKTGFSIT